MTRSFLRAQRIRSIAATIPIFVIATACQNDVVAGNYVECSEQPGCQQIAGVVPPAVIQSLDDANGRSLGVLQPASRGLIEAQLEKLKTALLNRNIESGRTALAAAVHAIDQAEKAHGESAPDLGVIRLALVPAARSLGLPINSTEFSTR